MNLAERCDKATATFPRDELYGLTSQLRRAAVSMPSNMAEGCCRRNDKVYAHHVAISLGSHRELETCIELAHRFGFLAPKQREALDRCTESVGRLLSGLHRSIEEKIARQESRRSPSNEQLATGTYWIMFLTTNQILAGRSASRRMYQANQYSP